MLISRMVTVKSRVTPALRAQLGAEVQRALLEIEHELARPSDQDGTLRPEKERQELLARRETLMKQLKDIAKLQDGQEVTRGQIQGFTEVKVGDVWPDLHSCEIILEDGRVVAIREGKTVTVSISAGTKGVENESGHQ